MATYTHAPFNEMHLIDRLKTGSNDAYAELYDRYAALLYGVIVRIVKEKADAENILQDTFVKIWHNIATYDASKGRLATWLLNIARNSAIDFTRSKMFTQRQKNESTDNLAHATDQKLSTTIETDVIDLKQIVARLSTHYREIIEWMYFDGYTQQEIANNFNMPLGTVKTRTRMALKELRTHFDK